MDADERPFCRALRCSTLEPYNEGAATGSRVKWTELHVTADAPEAAVRTALAGTRAPDGTALACLEHHTHERDHER